MPNVRRAVLLPVVALAALPALYAGFTLVDPAVLGWARGLHPAVVRFFRAITDLGQAIWPLAASIVVFGGVQWALRGGRLSGPAALVGRKASDIAVYLFLAVAGSGIAVQVLKTIFGRPRPKLYDALGPTGFSPFTWGADFASFPSGHATTVFAVAVAVAFLLPRLVVPLLLAAAFLTASRFIIGAHYFTDTVAGALLGAGSAALARTWMASRRWLFVRQDDGAVAVQAPTLIRSAWKRRSRGGSA